MSAEKLGGYTRKEWRDMIENKVVGEVSDEVLFFIDTNLIFKVNDAKDKENYDSRAEEWFQGESGFVTSEFLKDEKMGRFSTLGLDTEVLYECMESYSKERNKGYIDLIKAQDEKIEGLNDRLQELQNDIDDLQLELSYMEENYYDAMDRISELEEDLP